MKILVTRPLETASVLAQKIAEIGLTPVIFPAIEIKLLQAKPDLAGLDMMIFVSPAAVDAFLINIRSIPPAIALFSPGKDTALKIAQAGLGQAAYPENAAGAEALLAMPALQRVNGHKIMICKGKGGNPLITETLRARGAEVVEAMLYERVCPQVERLPDLKEIGWIICTSEEALKNLVKLFGDEIKSKKFLVSSARLSDALKTHGIKLPPLLAKQATDEALLTSLSALG